MFSFIRTDSGHKDFISLVKQLDAYLSVKDGEQHSFYDQYNKIDSIKHVVIAYAGDVPAGCGAFKEIAPGTAEIKRMFTLPDQRKNGIASGILSELELWAAGLNFNKCILETGKGQTEAISLYKKSGYAIIPNYGQYKGIDNSICFEKIIRY